MKLISGNQPFEFSPNLFWDVDPSQLDLEINKRFIIQRVVELGTLNDWNIVKKYYGLNTIGKELQNARVLDLVSLSFISKICGIKQEEFRCYTTIQSLPQHWNF